MKSILTITFAILLTACINKSNLRSGNYLPKPIKVALVSIKIIKSQSDYSVLITDSRLIDASLKNVDPKPDGWMENDFFCLVLDKKRKIRDSLIINQPLCPRYEFPQENGEIGSQVVELNENEVLLRFSYQKEYKWLRIGIVEKNRHFRTLNTLELSFKN